MTCRKLVSSIVLGAILALSRPPWLDAGSTSKPTLAEQQLFGAWNMTLHWRGKGCGRFDTLGCNEVNISRSSSFCLLIKRDGSFDITDHNDSSSNTTCLSSKSALPNTTVRSKNSRKTSIMVGEKPEPSITSKKASLSGRWRLRCNPYCLTDRHYDELCLESKPKVKFHVQQKKKAVGPLHEETYSTTELFLMSEKEWRLLFRKETISFVLHCQVRGGRFGCDGIREFLGKQQGRRSAYLSRGLLCVERDIRSFSLKSQNKAESKLKWENLLMLGALNRARHSHCSRYVIGTFSALPMSS